MNRFELLKLLQKTIQEELVNCNIGLPSQELYQIKDKPNYFYMAGRDYRLCYYCMSVCVVVYCCSCLFVCHASFS